MLVVWKAHKNKYDAKNHVQPVHQKIYLQNDTIHQNRLWRKKLSMYLLWKGTVSNVWDKKCDWELVHLLLDWCKSTKPIAVAQVLMQYKLIIADKKKVELALILL